MRGAVREDLVTARFRREYSLNIDMYNIGQVRDSGRRSIFRNRSRAPSSLNRPSEQMGPLDRHPTPTCLTMTRTETLHADILSAEIRLVRAFSSRMQSCGSDTARAGHLSNEGNAAGAGRVAIGAVGHMSKFGNRVRPVRVLSMRISKMTNDTATPMPHACGRAGTAAKALFGTEAPSTQILCEWPHCTGRARGATFGAL